MNFFFLVLLLLPSFVCAEVIKQSDLTFVGGFKMPSAVAYNRGLTVRYVNGDLKLYTVLYAGSRGSVYEIDVPDTLDKTYPFNQSTEYVNWGNIYQDKIVDTVDNGRGGTVPYVGIANDASEPSGLYWDETDQRMYWMKVVNYNNTGTNSDASLGYSILDDTTHTGTGVESWQLDDPATLGTGGWGGRYAFSMAAIPPSFANTYLEGKRLALGFGGGNSIISQGYSSLGPAVFAIAPPDPAVETHLANLTTPPTRLLSHFAYIEDAAERPSGDGMEGHSFRNYNNGDTLHWFIEDKSRYGVWVDTGSKQGILVWAHIGAGSADTTVTSVLSDSMFTVADAGDLRDGDIIRVYTSYEPSNSYPFEQPRISSVSGNTITLESATTGNISIGSVVQGGNWYAGGGPSATRFWTPLYIYDQNDLALVAQGKLDANAVTPDSNSNFALNGASYPIPGQLTGNAEAPAFVPRGMAYDETTNYIYFAAREDGGAGTDVWVYQVNSSSAQANSDTIFSEAPNIMSIHSN